MTEGLEDHVQRQYLALLPLFGTKDFREGLTSFLEKRPADYMGVRRRAAEGGSSEFIWGPPKGQCEECGATGIPAGFEYCGVCGASMEDTQPGGAAPSETEGASS